MTRFFFDKSLILTFDADNWKLECRLTEVFEGFDPDLIRLHRPLMMAGNWFRRVDWRDDYMSKLALSNKIST